MITKLYVLSKQIHRFCVFIIIALGLVMTTTGSLMSLANWEIVFPWIDYSFIRSFHANTSPFFSICLFVMMITGLYMYLFPLIKKRFNS